MDSSLHELWQTASGSPFVPTVGKDNQLFVGFSLLLLGFGLTGSFLLSMFAGNQPRSLLVVCCKTRLTNLLDRSLASVTYLGLPASLALAYVLREARGVV